MKLFILLFLSASTAFAGTNYVESISISGGSPSAGKIWTAQNSSGDGAWGTAAASSQTPWVTNIDAANFSLTNLGNLWVGHEFSQFSFVGTLTVTNNSTLGEVTLNGLTHSATNAATEGFVTNKLLTAQTPWTNTVDAVGNNLTNVSTGTFTNLNVVSNLNVKSIAAVNNLVVTNSIQALYLTTDRPVVSSSGGTVISGSLTMPSWFTVTPPLAVTANTQTSNNFLVGPTNGSAAAPTFRPGTNTDLWFSRIINGSVGQVSNTTSETSLINTNTTLGRTQGLQPDEMVAGRVIRFHLYGHTTQTSGQTLQYRIRIGGTSGTVVADTGSGAGLNITGGPWEMYGSLTFTSATTVRTWMCVHYPTLADKPSTTALQAAYTTITTSSQQQLVFTVQSNNSATVHETSSAVIEFY